MNLVTAALNGGEDYELLFTVPLTDHEKVSEMKGIKVIGHITKPDLGNYLVGRDGGEVEPKNQAVTIKCNCFFYVFSLVFLFKFHYFRCFSVFV